MKLITRTLNLGDVFTIAVKLPDEERQQLTAFTGRRYDIDQVVMDAMRFGGPKWAVVDEATPWNALVVGGFIPRRPGVFESWFLALPDVWVKGSGITEITAEIIRGQLESGAHRLETICLASRAQTRRWYERVGLKFEATLQNYGAHGEDAAVYVAFRQRVVN